MPVWERREGWLVKLLNRSIVVDDAQTYQDNGPSLANRVASKRLGVIGDGLGCNGFVSVMIGETRNQKANDVRVLVSCSMMGK